MAANDQNLATFLCFATLGYGIYCVLAMPGLQHTGNWLRLLLQRVQKSAADSRMNSSSSVPNPERLSDRLQP